MSKARTFKKICFILYILHEWLSTLSLFLISFNNDMLLGIDLESDLARFLECNSDDTRVG